MEFRVSGLGLKVQGFGFEVQGLGVREPRLLKLSEILCRGFRGLPPPCPCLRCPNVGARSMLKKGAIRASSRLIDSRA